MQEQEQEPAPEVPAPVPTGVGTRVGQVDADGRPDDPNGRDRDESARRARVEHRAARRALHVLRIVCRLAGALLVFAPAVLLLTSSSDLSTLPPSGLTLILGDGVVPPYATVPMLVVPGLLLTAAGFARRPRRGESPILLGCLLTGLAGFALAGSMAFLWLRSDGDYTLLDPPSDGGCRVIVLERFGLHDGFGALGVVQPGSMHVDWKRSYSSEDGHPYTSSNASPAWTGGTAVVPDPASVRTSTGAPLACE